VSECSWQLPQGQGSAPAALLAHPTTADLLHRGQPAHGGSSGSAADGVMAAPLRAAALQRPGARVGVRAAHATAAGQVAALRDIPMTNMDDHQNGISFPFIFYMMLFSI